jgi:hypothetical protein
MDSENWIDLAVCLGWQPNSSFISSALSRKLLKLTPQLPRRALSSQGSACRRRQDIESLKRLIEGE